MPQTRSCTFASTVDLYLNISIDELNKLKDSNKALLAEMNQYKNMMQHLYTILYRNDILKQEENNNNNNNKMMTTKNLLFSLNEWIERIQRENEDKENIEIGMKQCDKSRILVTKLLNKYNGNTSTKELTQKEESINNELGIYKTKINKNKQIINELKRSNHHLSNELNVSNEKCNKLEKQWISICNELKDTTNTKNELEQKCDRLHEEIKNHQSILQETRISTQEVIDEEQERCNKLIDELRELRDSNKILLAQKNDLTKQLHSKLENDIDTISNVESLQNEIESLNKENKRLKLNINTLKEINKKNVNEKDEDIIELNGVINGLKMECEELKALQTDYINLSKTYNELKQEYEIKQIAFNNLQIAFDAINNKEIISSSSKPNELVSNNDNNDLQTKLNEMIVKYENVTKQFQEIRSKFTQSQKYQIRLEHEAATLRSANLSNSDEQIDRRVIVKLLVTFFDRWHNGGDTKEVIILIAKILKFNDKQCKKCLFDNNQSLWRYAKDLGSLWVEFLLNELSDDDNNNNNDSTVS